MANYHFCTSSNSSIAGSSHFDYITGQNKYANKENEIVYAKNFIPSWSENDPNKFWEICSKNERTNSRDYREFRFSLPNELPLEENIKLVEQFAKETLNDKFYFSMVIHDKESEFVKNGIRNVHCHLMFSEREIDGIERTPENFFKRYNSKNPNLGGVKKTREFKSKDKLLELRKYTEELINSYYELNNMDKKVSCESLKKQREIALENGDILKAKMLDREPVNLEYPYIFSKKKEKLSKVEREYLEFFEDIREMKTLSEKLYEIEKNKLNLVKVEKDFTDESVNESIKNIDNTFDVNEYILTKRDIVVVDEEILNIEKKLDNLEMETLFKLDKDSYNIFRKLENLDKELFVMDNNLSESIESFDRRKDLEKSIFNYELSLDLRLQELKEKDFNLFDSTLNKLKTELIDKKIGLEINKNQFINKNIEMENQFKNSNNQEIFETKDYDVKMFISLKNDLLDVEKQIKKVEYYSSDEMIHNSALNTLTKGEFNKVSNEEKKVTNRLISLENELNSEKFGTSKYIKLELEKENLNMNLKDILDRKNILINKTNLNSLDKMKSTLKIKYKYKLVNLKKNKAIINNKYSYIKANILCNKKALTDLENLRNKYSKDNIIIGNKLEYLNKVKNNINDNFDKNIIDLAKNKYSKGRYYLILKESKKIQIQIKEIDLKIEKLGVLNILEKKKLQADKNNLTLNFEKLEKEYNNINNNFNSNKDIAIKHFNEVYQSKLRAYEKIDDQKSKLETKYLQVNGNIKEINEVLSLNKKNENILSKDNKAINNVSNVVNIFSNLCSRENVNVGHGTGITNLFDDDEENKNKKSRGLL